ncbi:hypothetical protein [Streptomyces sp. SA15]|uniref:hypothetical protein n=1 Tax=Streptomyces sp. SA15 TaxID=934019 RepID=UPI00117F867D|nr:hypothetical protein [Streptomyces sp. SA15]
MAHTPQLLPGSVAEILMDAADNFPARNWGVREFVRRVADATGDDEETAGPAVPGWAGGQDPTS